MSQTESDSLQRRATTRGPLVISAIAAAWVLSLGIDILLHGGLFAKLYSQPSAFLLGPAAAFQRIPLGYLAFLILTAALYWLLARLRVRGVAAGFRYGVIGGAIVWWALVVGLYSITTASWALLAAWWSGQALELGLAGAVLGAAANGTSMKQIWAIVLIAVVVCVAGVVVMQSLGLAPPMKMGS